MDICPVAHTSIQGDCRGSKILQKLMRELDRQFGRKDGRTSRSIPAEETSITEGPLLRLKAEGFLSDILLIEQQGRTEWQTSAEVSLRGQI